MIILYTHIKCLPSYNNIIIIIIIRLMAAIYCPLLFLFSARAYCNPLAAYLAFCSIRLVILNVVESRLRSRFVDPCIMLIRYDALLSIVSEYIYYRNSYVVILIRVTDKEFYSEVCRCKMKKSNKKILFLAGDYRCQHRSKFEDR